MSIRQWKATKCKHVKKLKTIDRKKVKLNFALDTSLGKIATCDQSCWSMLCMLLRYVGTKWLVYFFCSPSSIDQFSFLKFVFHSQMYAETSTKIGPPFTELWGYQKCMYVDSLSEYVGVCS